MKNSIDKSTLFLILFAVLLTAAAGPLFAGGTPEVPEIPPISSGTQYISPNGDDVQEEATISFESTLYVKSKEGYVPEYGLEIGSPSGEVVKEVVEKEKRDIGWFASLFTGYKKFTLSRSITWDGKDDAGNTVEDGTYSLTLWVSDPSGKKQEQQLDDFVVDTKAPEALIVEPDSLLFSPNGDGRKDTITISHTQATEEDSWTGLIQNDAEEEVKSYEWSGRPGEVVWDGRDDSSNAAPGARYRYVLSAVDRAGNESGDISLEGITLDRTETPIEVLIDPPEFSPNGDGIQDFAVAYLDQAVKEGIVGWSWSIRDIHNTLYETKKGEGMPPEEVKLDGSTTDGKAYPQDRFIFTYSVQYDHGNKPSVEEPFRIDVSEPKVRVNVENPIFSPDGDGRRDEAKLSFSSEEKVTWKGTISTEDGEEIRSVDSTKTTSLVVWDGKDKDGETLSDGTYIVSGVFTDTAGNAVKPAPIRIKIDTRPVSAVVKAEREGFSPNEDGVNDIMPFSIEANQHDDVQRWKLELTGTSGEVKRVFSGTETLPRSIVWDGDLIAIEEGGGESASEGFYTGRLIVEYAKGKTAEAETGGFYLDVTPPRVSMKVTKNPFAKSNGEVEGEVFIGIDIEEKESKVTEWTMDIVNEEGEVIRSYTGTEDPTDDISWNSPSEENRTKFGGERFTLKFEVSDAAGNTRTFSKEVTLDIFLVKKDGKYHIAVPNIIFGAYQHALDSRGPEYEKRNRDSIRRVADIYRRYPSYGLLLEGHALNIYRGVSEKRESDEEKILQPLTVRRAATVRDALIEEGMDGGQIETEAYGGTRPIVSVHDVDLRWKNRRVEFIMKKK